MDTDQKDPFGIESMISSWNRSMSDIMGAVNKSWFSFPASGSWGGPPNLNAAGNPKIASMAAAFRNWQTMVSATMTPESMNAMLKGSQAMPEMFQKYTQSVMDSISELHRRMGKSAGRLGESAEAYQFKDIDETIFHVWTEIYEKEFQKFFHVPQLGLTREYQERINDMMDKFHLFQGRYAEFMRLLNMPFQRSMAVMQDEVAKLTEAGELPEDFNEYYRMWIKILEGHFMTLFQTSEYIETMTATIGALSRFSKARDKVLEDMTRGLPFARKSEVEDMEKEMYELKKRLKMLEKKLKQHQLNVS